MNLFLICSFFSYLFSLTQVSARDQGKDSSRLKKTMSTFMVEKPPNAQNQLVLPPPGFGEFEVPEMPAYVQSYSSRGNSFPGETTPVYTAARWGNKTGRGGMAAYLSQLEDDTYFEGYKVKKGDAGVFDATRWAPGYDWRGNFGVASLSELGNYAGIPTRGGMLRKGAPKRTDIVDRPNYFFEKLIPGIETSRYTQKNNNYAGLYEYKKTTPLLILSNDMLDLREMIEHNPFHINSHAAKQAKAVYDTEFPGYQDKWIPAYQDHMDNAYVQTQIDRPEFTIRNTDPYLRPVVLPDGTPNHSYMPGSYA